MPAWAASDENSLPGLQTNTFTLCAHMAEREREKMSSLMSFLIKTLILLDQGPTLMSSLTLITSIKVLFPNKH